MSVSKEMFFLDGGLLNFQVEQTDINAKNTCWKEHCWMSILKMPIGQHSEI